MPSRIDASRTFRIITHDPRHSCTWLDGMQYGTRLGRVDALQVVVAIFLRKREGILHNLPRLGAQIHGVVTQRLRHQSQLRLATMHRAGRVDLGVVPK